MRAKLLITLTTIGCLSLLTSCSVPYSYPKQCAISMMVKTPCNKCIEDRCEYICKKCSYNEPTCGACWQCIKQDVCTNGLCVTSNCGSKAAHPFY